MTALALPETGLLTSQKSLSLTVDLGHSA